MKYYIIAGEPSGDLHASYLMKAIKKQDETADFRCWGGDKMEKEGGEIVKHYNELAFMGFIEVVQNLKTILNNLVICKTDILLYDPDVIILVDYPGFNLKIAKFAKENNFKVVYYISPQVWAWKKNRVHKIKKYVDKMLTILPFEKEFYAKYNYEVEYVGHPLLDEIDDFSMQENAESDLKKEYQLSNKPIIALLPGSRKQEIKTMLPIMMQLVPHFPDFQFVISGVKWIKREIYDSLLQHVNIPIIFDNQRLLQCARAAVVTSGTATLETALFNVPQIICYKGNYFSYLIAKWLIKDIQFISLVNLIANKKIVQELIQYDVNVKNLEQALTQILYNQQIINEMHQNYSKLKTILGEGGASERGAEVIRKIF